MKFINVGEATTLASSDGTLTVLQKQPIAGKCLIYKHSILNGTNFIDLKKSLQTIDRSIDQEDALNRV